MRESGHLGRILNCSEVPPNPNPNPQKFLHMVGCLYLNRLPPSFQTCVIGVTGTELLLYHCTRNTFSHIPQFL